MLVFLGIIAVCVLAILALFHWFSGRLGGAFAGFIPITLICLMANYSDSSGHGGPTKESTNQALIVAAAITLAPYLWRLFKEFVSSKNSARNNTRNT